MRLGTPWNALGRLGAPWAAPPVRGSSGCGIHFSDASEFAGSIGRDSTIGRESVNEGGRHAVSVPNVVPIRRRLRISLFSARPRGK
jgi:hypothetical protein